jgi:uncharacterized protein (TIGR02231 family)
LSARRRPLALVAAAAAVIGGQAVPPATAETRGEKVPGVVMSPRTAEGAAIVDARIAEVTVFSDRARVRRRARATGKAGVEIVRFPSLPGAVFLDTVRVSATGGRVLRVEATPVERERTSIAQAAKLLDALDAVDDRLVEIEDRRLAEDWEVGFLRALRPAAPVPEDKREGRKNLVVDTPSWWKALDFLGLRTRGASDRLLKIDSDQREASKERDRIVADVQALNRGGFSDRVVDVVAIVDGTGGPKLGAELELEYFVPGARWKPAYDLHYASARGQIRVETAAVVEQTTGEDWTDTVLLLSTAMPGRGIDLPELLTWTLGEKSEFIPQLRPRRAPPAETPLPVATARSNATDSSALDAELVRARLAQALASEGGGDRFRAQQADAQKNAENYQEQVRRVRLRKAMQDEAMMSARAAPARSAPSPSSAGAPPAMAPAPAPPPPSEAAMDMEEAEGKPSNISWQDIVAVPRKTKMGSASAYRAPLGLPLVDATAPSRGPVLSDPYLPAVSAGGLDYVYQSPTRATIASSSKQVRIPLASQTFQASTFHEATPALAPTAFLRARVRNDGKRPLLRGPATIFGDGELVGVGEIQTTGPGGDIELPLGADQDVKLVRQVVPSTKTTGVIMKADETTYDVQIQVANYKKQKVTVEIADQVPRSQRDKVEVKLLGVQPAATGAPDADGVVKWRVDLAPGATQTLKLSYRITRPKDWQLYQN